MKLKREIRIEPAFDKRSHIPGEDYGICSCRIYFAVIGSKGAITVNFYTNWYLPSTVKEYREEGIYRNQLSGGKEPFKTKIDLEKDSKPIRAGSWDYHSKKKRFEGQDFIKNCGYTGKKCYCDGSYLKADKYLTLLLEKGSEGVFEQLEKDYKIEFRT
jgi:hypothetical protein